MSSRAFKNLGIALAHLGLILAAVCCLPPLHAEAKPLDLKGRATSIAAWAELRKAQLLTFEQVSGSFWAGHSSYTLKLSERELSASWDKVLPLPTAGNPRARRKDSTLLRATQKKILTPGEFAELRTLLEAVSFERSPSANCPPKIADLPSHTFRFTWQLAAKGPTENLILIAPLDGRIACDSWVLVSATGDRVEKKLLELLPQPEDPQAYHALSP